MFFQLYNPTGMINQVMSLELAVGLSHVTGKKVIVHYISNNGDNLYNYKKVPIFTPSRWYNQQRQGFVNNDQFPHLSDILEWDEDLVLIDEKIESFPQQELEIEDLLNNYYYSETLEPSEEEFQFADGRQKLPLDKTLHLKRTLGWYSRFFFNRTSSLDAVLSSVKFKKEYLDFADMVANKLEDFQGGHLRLSDHVKMFNTTQEMFESGLLELESNGLPIVISTDEPSHPMVVANRHRFILLDEFIVNNFEKEFKSLPFQDEVVFGLTCNLVMQKSKHFIGTSGSTYTAYIHRKRNMDKDIVETWSFWDKPNANHSGKFSWYGYDLDPGRKMWWREWPESKLNF